MNEAVLPPSPNWYLSSVLACSNNGTVAWGKGNMIVIAKRTENSKILKYSMIRNAHNKDKVTSLSFSPEFGKEGKNLLVSGGDEHIVKIWNLDDLSIVLQYSYTDIRHNVAAVEWSRKDPNLIYFISSEGLLISWNVSFDIGTPIPLGKLTATCLACCPHKADLVAVGSKSGLVYIISVHGAKPILYKLRGHDADIVSLSWCPVDTNVFKSDNNKELLLASGGKDKSVFIWKAGSSGRIEREIYLPVNPLDSQQHRTKLNSTVGNWTTVCWLKPTLLLASSVWGELISWDLLKTVKNKPVWNLIHACHSRGLFAIAAMPDSSQNTSENWRAKTSSTIWTVAQDRRVVCCKIHEQNVEIEYNIPTQGGYVYCLAACPLETSVIAFGSGDAMLRIWNLSEPHESTFDITSLWQRVKDKIRAISWHPSKENLIAYATSEGRIGVFDTNGNKPPILCRQYHRSIIYALGWGPDPNKKEQYSLYSCAEGELVYYDFEKPKQEPVTVLKKECTEFSWKSDFSCLAVGLDNGSIVYFDKNLKKCGCSAPSVVPLQKAMHCLVWHPESTSTDLALSSMQNYLAVASDTTAIIVFDLTDLIDNMNDLNVNTANESDNDTNLYKTHKIVATLHGHREDVVCLAWSPHFTGYLISGSYDSTVQIWKVETQELIGTYVKHCGPVLACLWSPLNPDLIITGSTDCSIQIWKLSEQKAIMPTEKTKLSKVKNKKKSQNKQKNKVNITVNVTDVSDHFDTDVDKDTSITVLVEDIKELAITQQAETKENTEKKKDKQSSTLDRIREIIRSHEDSIEKKVGETETDDCSNICSSPDREYLLTSIMNASKYKTSGNMLVQLDLWDNKLKQRLEEATKQKCLTDFLVSLAPSLSMKTWMETCEAYAAQLVAQGNPQKAASYLLCIHKIIPAVQVLSDAKLYKEAFAIAQCRLDPAEPMYRIALVQWAEYECKTGNFEQAALCYVKLGEYSKAAVLLARRDSVDCLECAIELLSSSVNEDPSKSILISNYAEQAVRSALLNQDYAAAQKIISNVPEIKHYEVLVSALMEIMNVIEAEDKDDRVETWLKGNSNYGMLETLRNLYTDDSYYLSLVKNYYSIVPENKIMLWLNVSHQIAMAVTCNNEEKRICHIVEALGSISQFEILHRKIIKNSGEFLIHILSSLDNKIPCSKESIYSNKSYPVTKSLRAYLCLGLLNWLTRSTNVDELINLYLEEIENLFEDVLDRDTVKFSTLTNDINKLESQLVSALGVTQDVDESGDAKEDTTVLLNKLDELKSEKQNFIQQRVCAPAPILAFSKASELGSKISDENTKTKFMYILSGKWSAATM